MTTRSHSPSSAAKASQQALEDQALREALRQLPSPITADESEALQARILAQWDQSCAGKPAASAAPASTFVLNGRGLLLGSGPGAHRWRLAAVAIVLSVVAASAWWAQQRPDPTLDEDLMHPDVLSLMAIDEM